MARNAVLAALYAAVALALPATALANYRLSTALYVLAAVDPGLVPGLAVGNALAGLPQGAVDLLLGGLVGLVTAGACARAGPRLAPFCVLLLPTLMVPVWLSVLFQAPYIAVALAVLQGQIVSAALGALLVSSPRVWSLLRR